MRWEFYIKDKGGFIKRNILVAVPHTKEGKIIWTCVKDNFIKEK